ncbi:MAG: DUF1800 domain-containing protein [Alphaproteobacteria bacterium]
MSSLLHRISHGATAQEQQRLAQIGWPAYVDEQLKGGEDQRLQDVLASAKLLIEHGFTHEYRPLSSLNKPINQLWHLSDWQESWHWEERIRPAREVAAATWLRAIYSRWQLQEVLVDFWHNHFHVNAGGDNIEVAVALPEYDRAVIRPHLLGNFREMLEAVAQSTAMLAYLNNASSRASPANENYARELFELHTLGAGNYYNHLYNRWRDVPGAEQGSAIGYIDQDVYEAARALTGWTIASGYEAALGQKFPTGGGFYYHDAWHDNYQKRILGVEFEPNQPPLADGRKLLDLVAYHAGTAQHLCWKLCRRLVADNPSAQLVRSAAALWISNARHPNQISIVVRHILLSAEYTSQSTSKAMRPLALLVAMQRHSGIALYPEAKHFYLLKNMGQHLFSWPAPNGHPDGNDYWLQSGFMLRRWQAIHDLAVDIIKAAPAQQWPSPEAFVQDWAGRLAPNNLVVKPQALAILREYVGAATIVLDSQNKNQQWGMAQAIGLIASMPERQLG